jgi:hypothetical protein
MPKTGVFAVMTLALSLGSIVAFGKPNKGPKDGTNCPQRHANLGTKVCCAYDGND